MQAIVAIRTTLKFSDMGMKYLADMSDAPLLRPGPWGGNHAMWIAGHLTVESQMREAHTDLAQQRLTRKAWRLARKLARELIQQDVALTKPQHAALRERAIARFPRAVELFRTG